MESLIQIRQAYDDNYAQIMNVIQQMGGDQNIKFHRKKRSSLFYKLQELQQKEHYLDEMENQILNFQPSIH